MNALDQSALNTILQECRHCGACCRRYRKIVLQPEEVDFITKMGGYVGTSLSLRDLRGQSIEEAAARARESGRVYMVHPDSRGCVFLEKRNRKHHCRIYHHRPKSCRGFRCNFADNTFREIFGEDAVYLLGKDRFGFPLK